MKKSVIFLSVSIVSYAFFFKIPELFTNLQTIELQTHTSHTQYQPNM